MAKIKQVKMRLGLNPRYEHLETVVDICYDGTDRRTSTYRRPVPEERFYIKLPQVVADALGQTEVRAKDQESVFEVFEQTLEKFKKMHTERNRVICYKFEVDPVPGKERTWYGSGYLVKVWAGTYEEVVTIAGDGQRRYSYEKIESPINYPSSGESYDISTRVSRAGERCECQVPWNEKNEKFFLWVQGCMAELVTRLNELVEPEALIESINAGRLLPMGETKGVSE